MTALVQEKCSFCGIDERVRLRCAQCKKTWYCSPEHQKLHWKEHKPICIIISKNHYMQNKSLESMKSMTVGSSQQSYKENSLGLAEYDMLPSPAVPLKPKATISDQASTLVNCLLNLGYCIIDEFLGETVAQKVLWDVTKLVRSGIMKNGELVQADNKVTKQEVVRGDKIAWISGKEEHYENMKLIINPVDQLIRHSQRNLPALTIQGRTPAMVARYPGDGTGYKRHVDNMQKDGRRLTCLYYLNKAWNAKSDGGLLRLYPFAKKTYVDVEPAFDRLLVFWSDTRTPHEVLPAFRERVAITLWYFDAAERDLVKQAYIEKLKSSFSKSTRSSSPAKSTSTTNNDNSSSSTIKNSNMHTDVTSDDPKRIPLDKNESRQLDSDGDKRTKSTCKRGRPLLSG